MKIKYRLFFNKILKNKFHLKITSSELNSFDLILFCNFLIYKKFGFGTNYIAPGNIII